MRHTLLGDIPDTMTTLPVLFSRNQIQNRINEMGAQITHDFKGESLILIGVLKGASIFLSDLARTIDLDATFDFIGVSSYGKGTKHTGEVRLTKDLDQSVEGRNVLLVEDILDTGLTLAYLKKIILAHQPRTLAMATLLDKPSRRIEAIEAEYVGFEIPNEFVVGYGMDFAERYRNLADICILPAELQAQN